MASPKPFETISQEMERKNRLLLKQLEAFQNEEQTRVKEERKLSLLLEASGRLLKTLKIDDVAAGVIDLCRQLIPADGCILWQLNGSPEPWTILRKSGISKRSAEAFASQLNAVGEQAALLKKVIWVQDVAHSSWCEGMETLYDWEGIRSLLVAPMEFHTKPLGMIIFYFRKDYPFSGSDSRIATSLADLASAALRSASLYEERVSLWRKELGESLRATFLSEVGLVFNSAMQPKKILEEVASKAVPFFADWCFAGMLNDDGRPEIQAVSHIEEAKIAEFKKIRRRFSEDLRNAEPCILAYKTGKPQLLSTLLPDAFDSVPQETRNYLLSLELKSCLLVPIRIRGRTAGLISFFQAESGRRFNEADLATAEELAQRVALSVDRALLHHRAKETLEAREDLLRKLQKQIRQQAALMAVSQRGLSHFDLKTMFEDTAFWVVKTLNIEHCVILEFSTETASFRIKTASGWSHQELASLLTEGRTAHFFRKAFDATSPVLFESRDRKDQFDHLSLFERGDVSSVIVTPIKAPKSHFGVIAAFSKDSQAFSQDDIQFLQAISNIVASAVDRFETEQALRHSERKYRQLFNMAPNGILFADSEFRITGANTEALRLFGYPAEEEVLGFDLTELLLPGEGVSVRQFFEKEFPDEGVRDREIVLMRSDGSEFSAEVSLEVIKGRSDDRVTYFGIVHDITQRRELERMKSEFIETVSHELRTPLTSISASLDLIASGSVSSDSDRFAELFDIAAANSERLMNLINDFLDFQKIESGKLRLNILETDLEALIEQAVLLNESYAEHFGVHFALHLDCQGAEIAIDSERFFQVLTNLLSNAAKFSPTGAEIEVGASQGKNDVRIWVKNPGSTIPEEFRSKLFGKFVQIDSSLNRKHQGSGLGLAIAKSLVEEMGGTIDYRSDATSTEFFLNFPICERKMAN